METRRWRLSQTSVKCSMIRDAIPSLKILTNRKRGCHDQSTYPCPVLAHAGGRCRRRHLVAVMSAHTFTSLVRYALITLLFIVVGAAAALVLGSVAVCLGRWG